MKMKKILIITSVVIVLIAGISIVYSNDLVGKYHKRKIEIKAVYDSKNCGLAKPLAIAIKNGSSKPINKMNYSILIRRKGHSDNIAEYMDYLDSDEIINPGGFGGGCIDFTLGYEYARRYGLTRDEISGISNRSSEEIEKRSLLAEKELDFEAKIVSTELR